MIVPDYIERSKRKTLSLAILKDGNVIVKAPINMKDADINRFVEDKQSWIREKLASIKENQNKFEDVISHKKCLIYGNKYTLVKSNVKSIQTNDKFEILVPEKFEDNKVEREISNWFKKFAKKVLGDRLSFIENRINLKSNSFKIGDSRGRWGSCNYSGNIILNYRVVMLPPKIIDYVIVHELCHLIELNHSRNFWANVEKFLPNYELSRKGIKEYGFLLNMY